MTPATFLTSWRFDPVPFALTVAAATLYLVAARRVWRTRGPSAFPRRRASFFFAGLGVLLVALESPVHAYAGRLLSVHMAQHLMITMVAAPLLVLGTPAMLALQASSRGVRRSVLLPVLHGPVGRVVGWPVLGWALFAAVMWATHVPPLYVAAVRSEAIHTLEHVAYLVAALLFWLPVVGLDPSPRRLSHPARLLYLFLSMPVTAVLGLAIYSASHVLYQPYVASTRSLGLSPLGDQHLAGALMWEGGMLVMVVALGAVLFDWLAREEREAEREDARRVHDVARATGSTPG
ncbi:MAG: cytochrome c oxidase assembly protein [Actinomycetota bacterium]|nr:cytochrome c oxidase assembly protein [Actinomycetota bacterium]